MMKDEIQIIRADKEKLISVRKELEEIMEQSAQVNFSLADVKEYSVSRFQALILYFEQGKAQVYLAIYHGKIAGYLWFFEKDKNRIHINEIAVHEKFRGKGIGKKLLKEVIVNARVTGHSNIELFCMESNSSARNFYDKNGFMTEKRLMVRDI